MPLARLKRFAVFALIACLDKHKVHRFGQGTSPFVRKSNRQRGKTKFEFYAFSQSRTFRLPQSRLSPTDKYVSHSIIFEIIEFWPRL